jgi:hypothetical protein
MADKFKMATKTKFAYIAKKTLVRHRTFGLLKKLKKMFGRFKIKNGCSIQDDRQNLIYF